MRRQHLERHDAIHGLMDRLVYSAHAALADLIDDLVLAEEESCSASDQQQSRLELGEQTLLDERARDRSPANRVRYALEDIAAFTARNQAALPQVEQKSLSIHLRHRHCLSHTASKLTRNSFRSQRS